MTYKENQGLNGKTISNSSTSAHETSNTTITIINSTYQNKIEAFEKALSHLRYAMQIIRTQAPTLKEHKELTGYAGAIFEAETDCSSTIIDLSTAISELVKDNISNSYL
uniref:hypothetical protein n=1 Tax=uncultured Dysgonomonas sp. TaxID=206096 RepID=UPI00260AD4CE|nr:hypothetical protein [uncultured Dysgonomonas sp.]